MKQDPTEDSVIKEIMFGHCSFAPKDFDKHKCLAIFQRYYNGVTKVGRKKVDGLIYIDEYYKCTCLCHIPEDERPKPKPTRRRRTKK